MPLFAKKPAKIGLDSVSSQNDNNNLDASCMDNVGSGGNNINNNNIGNLTSNGNALKQQFRKSSSPNGQRSSSASSSHSKPQLIFHCQLAHGSPTGLITGFSSVRELYQKVADCYDIPVEDILFCTLNSHKVDMNKLLGGQIGLDDFVFAHRKGQPKEIEILKADTALGLTITDNGAGYAFIKRIKEGSIIDQIGHIKVGDHIEKINDQSMVGKRHYEVARTLKEIPQGESFTIRLVEPMNTGFQGIGPRSQSRSSTGRGYGSGKETLRFKANGQVEIEQKCDSWTQSGIDAINNLLESFMGINDSELATQIWDLGEDKSNSMDFAEAIDNSELETFGFTDDFIIELWGAITDARRERNAKK